MFEIVCCFLFFFKQKTAYEMRISDWSSDVCSSDLAVSAFRERSLEQLRLGSRVLPDLTTERFAATGMQRMSATELKSLQEEIRQRMEEAGYPGGGVDARAKVDRAIARTLVELDLPVGEMLRPDVWTWMSKIGRAHV